MLVRDLITKLEKLIHDHDNGDRYYKGEDMLGEADIMFDYYKPKGEIHDEFWGTYESDDYEYAGITPDMEIQTTRDGVYKVLTAVATKKE